MPGHNLKWTTRHCNLKLLGDDVTCHFFGGTILEMTEATVDDVGINNDKRTT